MIEVTAYQDVNGRLHKTKREAVESDFIELVRKAWGHMPDQRDHGGGDPVVIARILASDIYPSARRDLRDAIVWLEEALA